MFDFYIKLESNYRNKNNIKKKKQIFFFFSTLTSNSANLGVKKIHEIIVPINKSIP